MHIAGTRTPGEQAEMQKEWAGLTGSGGAERGVTG